MTLLPHTSLSTGAHTMVLPVVWCIALLILSSWEPCDGQVCSGVEERVVGLGSLGVISEGVSAGEYTTNKTCVWVLSTPVPGGVISLESIEFALECGWDYVYVRDGNATEFGNPEVDAGAPILGVFSGSSPIPLLVSSGPVISIHFHSDDYVVDRGFRIQYKVSSCPLACGFDGLCGAGGVCNCNSPPPPPQPLLPPPYTGPGAEYCMQADDYGTCGTGPEVLCSCSDDVADDPDQILARFYLEGYRVPGGIMQTWAQAGNGAVCSPGWNDGLPYARSNISCPGQCQDRQSLWRLQYCPGLFDEEEPPSTLSFLLPLFVAFFLIFVVIFIAIVLRSRHGFTSTRTLREGDIRPPAPIAVHTVLLRPETATPTIPFPVIVPEACDGITVPMYVIVGPPPPGELFGRITLGQHIHIPHAPKFPPDAQTVAAYADFQRQQARELRDRERAQALAQAQFLHQQQQLQQGTVRRHSHSHIHPVATTAAPIPAPVVPAASAASMATATSDASVATRRGVVIQLSNSTDSSSDSSSSSSSTSSLSV